MYKAGDIILEDCGIVYMTYKDHGHIKVLHLTNYSHKVGFSKDMRPTRGDIKLLGSAKVIFNISEAFYELEKLIQKEHWRAG